MAESEQDARQSGTPAGPPGTRRASGGYGSDDEGDLGGDVPRAPAGPQDPPADPDGPMNPA